MWHTASNKPFGGFAGAFGVLCDRLAVVREASKLSLCVLKPQILRIIAHQLLHHSREGRGGGDE